MWWGKELTLKNGCLFTPWASSFPPPKRLLAFLTKSLDMKSDASGDKSPEMVGFVFSIWLQKRNPFLYLSLQIYIYILKYIHLIFTMTFKMIIKGSQLSCRNESSHRHCNCLHTCTCPTSTPLFLVIILHSKGWKIRFWPVMKLTFSRYRQNCLIKYTDNINFFCSKKFHTALK